MLNLSHDTLASEFRKKQSLAIDPAVSDATAKHNIPPTISICITGELSQHIRVSNTMPRWLLV